MSKGAALIQMLSKANTRWTQGDQGNCFFLQKRIGPDRHSRAEIGRTREHYEFMLVPEWQPLRGMANGKLPTAMKWLPLEKMSRLLHAAGTSLTTSPNDFLREKTVRRRSRRRNLADHHPNGMHQRIPRRRFLRQKASRTVTRRKVNRIDKIRQSRQKQVQRRRLPLSCAKQLFHLF